MYLFIIKPLNLKPNYVNKRKVKKYNNGNIYNAAKIE